MTTENYLLKLLWTVVILCVFGVGVFIISQAVADFYKFDKITNIERVYPESVTFPAITICTFQGYSREYYINGSLIKKDENVYTNLLKQFLNFQFTYFYSFNNDICLEVNNHLDIFKIYLPTQINLTNETIDCLRFNAVTNRSVELFKANSFADGPRITLNKFFIEDISENEYYNYTFSPYNNFQFFWVYFGDNSLNSFENLKLFEVSPESFYVIEIVKSIESKLPEPYNPCKKSSVDEPYHQMNCIEACTYKEIKNKYNCTFLETLFSIQGFRQCVLNYTILKTEFSSSCMKECPLESCFSEKIDFFFIKHPLSINSTYFMTRFHDLSILNITQIPKLDPFTFLNNIGGGLGLFMGIAVPNLIEFFQFILEIVLIIFIRKTN